MAKYVPTQQEIDEATKYYSSVATYLEGGGGAKAYLLEQKGWEEWLMTLFPLWFSEEFSKEHRQFWELRWDVLHRLKEGKPVANKEKIVLLFLSRGLGKSMCMEAARIMRSAICGKGYSLMISETEGQAQEHLGNVRILINSPDSRLLEYYPQLAITDTSDVTKGMPTADRKELFICKNGWICRAKGLTAKMRGLRIGEMRPDEIVLDDIDEVSDSLAVSLNKEHLITASILPVQPPKKGAIIDFGQNLILEHGFANRLYTGKSDALSDRTVIGVTNAFDPLELDHEIDETGNLRHYINERSRPTWVGLDIEAAQKFLHDVGLQTFLAEYQNQFDQYRSGRVISNYDEDRQIITWSQFKEVFGTDRIPAHWKCLAGVDIGYSEGLYPHWSVWNFIATAALNSPVPNALFLYRSRSWKGMSIDDQADKIKESLYSEEMEMIQQWLMSHEKTGEMMTLRQKHNLPMQKFRRFKSDDGIAQWKHLSMTDRKKPHPFKEDTLDADGTYQLGRPTLFYVVDDDQVLRSTDDHGLRLFREQVSTWDYVPVKITETGRTEQKPSKVNDDHGDCFKMLVAHWAAAATELTPHEELEIAMPEAYRMENMLKNSPYKQRLTDAQQFSRSLVEAEVREKINMPYEDEWFNERKDVESWEVDGW